VKHLSVFAKLHLSSPYGGAWNICPGIRLNA
jgi:hypothetical protein